MSLYKPQGYSSVSPYLIVDDARRTITFLVMAFDAVELRRFLHPSGQVMHAEVRVDDTIELVLAGLQTVQAEQQPLALKERRLEELLGVRAGKGAIVGKHCHNTPHL
jgi:hypothetical protein